MNQRVVLPDFLDVRKVLEKWGNVLGVEKLTPANQGLFKRQICRSPP